MQILKDVLIQIHVFITSEILQNTETQKIMILCRFAAAEYLYRLFTLNLFFITLNELLISLKRSYTA